MNDRERYVQCMVRGAIDACISIEKAHDLFGYPPELVCIGLSAVEVGQDPHYAIEAYINQTEESAAPLAAAQGEK